MRKVSVLYNSRSGGRRSQRQSDLQSVLKILRGAGAEASLTLTTSSADAADQARKSIADGCDTVFACGGDGTVHDVLQGMVGTRATLGVIPMGTANALAHDLGLPLEPARAVEAVLNGELRRIAVGRVEVQGFQGSRTVRYFTVAVGVGVDAHLFYKLHSGMKQRMGMAAYYAKAWQLWFGHDMQEFVIEHEGAGGAEQRMGVTELLAVRIRNFGGVLRELAPGASLDRNDLRLVICQTSSRLAYLRYVTRSLLGANWKVPGVELLHSEGIRCDYLEAVQNTADQPRVYVEADGELVGTLPADISIIPDALTLLGPKTNM